MKKFTTKTLLALACVAVAGIQTVGAADMLTTHAGDVLSGASIHSHTAGLQSVVKSGKSATLNFNADTRIDWSKLNVAKDETLNFKNGNFAVLNNVLGKSITKVAGKINGENGKIIISNPNGILFQGGKFETSGAAILTTKDLTSYAADQIAGLDADAIKDLANGSDFKVIAITEGSSITAGDINIIANGVNVDGSNLLANDGDVLVTADGANYVKSTNSVTMKADDGTSKTVTFKSSKDNNRDGGYVYSPVYVSNSAVKSENGDINLVSGDSVYVTTGSSFDANNTNVTAETGNIYLNPSTSGSLDVNGNLNADAAIRVSTGKSEINGDTSFTATRISMNGGTYNGNLALKDDVKDYGTNVDNVISVSNITVNGDKFTINEGESVSNLDPVYLKNVTAPNAEVKANARVLDCDNVNLGKTDVETYGYAKFANHSVINGDLNVKTDSNPNIGTVHLGGYTTITDADGNSTRGNLREGETFDVKGNLTIDSGSTVGIAGKVTVDGKADITTRHSSVVYATSSNDNIDCSIDAKDGLKINAPESLNELLPLNGDITVTTELKEGSRDGMIVSASRYFEEMQRDYVQTREPKPDPDPDPINPDVPDDDVSKLLDNMIMNGVDISSQSFTPIAFAADEDQDLVKRIAKIVFKTPENIVSISDRLIQKDINGSF